MKRDEEHEAYLAKLDREIEELDREIEEIEKEDSITIWDILFFGWLFKLW